MFEMQLQITESILLSNSSGTFNILIEFIKLVVASFSRICGHPKSLEEQIEKILLISFSMDLYTCSPVSFSSYDF